MSDGFVQLYPVSCRAFKFSVKILFDFQNPGPPLSHMPALTLDGEKIKRSLFGFAMAVAGDLNRDGYPGMFLNEEEKSNIVLGPVPQHKRTLILTYIDIFKILNKT